MHQAPYIGLIHLRRILEASEESDWAKPETVRELYGVYSGITGERFDESIFEGMQ